MRLVVHAGLPRAGSTSIQYALWSQRERLSKNGIRVMHTGDSSQVGDGDPLMHECLGLSALGHSDAGTHLGHHDFFMNALRDSDYGNWPLELNSSTVTDLHKEILQTERLGFRVALLSSEGFAGVDPRSLASLLPSDARVDLHFVVVLRAAASWIRSSASWEASRLGTVGTVPYHLSRVRNQLLVYPELLEREYRKSNVHVAVLEAWSTVSAAFERASGAPLLGKVVDSARKLNESPDDARQRADEALGLLDADILRRLSVVDGLTQHRLERGNESIELSVSRAGDIELPVSLPGVLARQEALEERLAFLNQERARLELTLASIKSERDSMASELESAKSVFSQLRQQLRESSAQLGESRATIERLGKQVASSRSEIKRLSDHAHAGEVERRDLLDRLGALDWHFHEDKQRIANLESELEAERTILRKIFASRSWRITSWFRRMMGR